MERKLYSKLLDWKKESQGSSALLIDGARRVGKSYLAEEFGKNEYRSYLKIDFYKASPALKQLFLDYLDDLDTFFAYLSALTGTSFHERDTLIVFDEVQFFPKARAAIKYLVEDGRYDYIETGSLLSIKENTEDIMIPSEEEHVNLYPLDFEEFLWAFGERQLFPLIRDSFEKQTPLPLALHKKAEGYFRRYLLLGGMPQVINRFAKTNSFDRADKEKRNILTLYRNDILKHSGSYKAKAAAIFDNIPGELSRHGMPFRLSSLNKGARYRDYDDAFFYLSDSKICNMCYKSDQPNLGLSMNKGESTLKCYMGDTGLLLSLAFSKKEASDGKLYEKLLTGSLSFNEGMVAENAVSQMLVASGHPLFFYGKESAGKQEASEIDFLVSKPSITSRHNISPIEVKSGENLNAVSLRKFMERYKDYLYVPYIVHNGQMKQKDGIRYIPFYMVPLL